MSSTSHIYIMHNHCHPGSPPGWSAGRAGSAASGSDSYTKPPSHGAAHRVRTPPSRHTTRTQSDLHLCEICIRKRSVYICECVFVCVCMNEVMIVQFAVQQARLTLTTCLANVGLGGWCGGGWAVRAIWEQEVCRVCQVGRIYIFWLRKRGYLDMCVVRFLICCRKRGVVEVCNYTTLLSAGKVQ